MTTPLISVVICTQNRAGLLLAALHSLHRPAAPRVPHEIIVVDNGSTDDTAAVVAALGLPNLSCLHVPEPGLSRARNAGWQAAAGVIVAFLDDDAEALPGWIDSIAEGLGHHPGMAAIGGPVQPVWHAPRPDWLTDEIAHSLTILDWGSTPRRLAVGREWLVGANFAVRRDVLARIGGFHPRLGRQGALLLSNEETFLLRQIDRLGLGVLYWPAMAVRHPVPPGRLDPVWLLQRHFWQGISDARLFALEGDGDAASLRSRAAQAAAALPLPDPPAGRAGSTAAAAFTRRCRAMRDVGFVAGLLAEAGA